MRDARVQATDYLILLLAGACLGTMAEVSDVSFGYTGYQYTVIAVFVTLLCMIGALITFSQDKLQYKRESASGMNSLSYYGERYNGSFEYSHEAFSLSLHLLFFQLSKIKLRIKLLNSFVTGLLLHVSQPPADKEPVNQVTDDEVPVDEDPVDVVPETQVFVMSSSERMKKVTVVPNMHVLE
ncbi:hypothetical protein L2E82_50548 [Cichorium intybus]|nr:hypothetical protein L2E82_50548 [Cichorium intybus]